MIKYYHIKIDMPIKSYSRDSFKRAWCIICVVSDCKSQIIVLSIFTSGLVYTLPLPLPMAADKSMSQH